MEQSKENDQLFLELGSFIKIIAPSNPDLNDKSFYIQYLDSNEVDLLDVDTLSKKTLTLSDGNLDDKSIEEFEILSRPEARGFLLSPWHPCLGPCPIRFPNLWQFCACGRIGIIPRGCCRLGIFHP